MMRGALIALVVLTTSCGGGSAVPRPDVVGGNASRGKVAIAKFGCGGCHAIPGVPGSVGRVGPSLAGFADRAYVAGGTVNVPDSVIQWIRAPRSMRPNTVMPAMGVNAHDARDIVAYLYSLTERRLGAPHLFPVAWLGTH